MTVTVEAVYDDGVLKPAERFPLRGLEHVRITVYAGARRARQTAGLVRWSGDPAALQRCIMDPELDHLEGP
jgi:predicted DNA-binding antitoxin AbrB/MazE fold protein